MDVLPPCGIGGVPTVDHPCTGSSGMPSDAGGGVFSGVTAAPAVFAILAAGLLLVGLLFAVWATRKVASFFRSAPSEGPDALLYRHGQAWAQKQQAAAWRGGVYGAPLGISHDSDSEADAELDIEDDSPDDNPDDEPGQLRLEHGK